MNNFLSPLITVDGCSRYNGLSRLIWPLKIRNLSFQVLLDLTIFYQIYCNSDRPAFIYDLILLFCNFWCPHILFKCFNYNMFLFAFLVLFNFRIPRIWVNLLSVFLATFSLMILLKTIPMTWVFYFYAHNSKTWHILGSLNSAHVPWSLISIYH